MLLASLPVSPVAKCAVVAAPSRTGYIREYWLQADTIDWNVVPNGRDEMSGGTFTADQTTFRTMGYRAYSPNWQSLLPGSPEIGENAGIPGPVIRANVGDTLVVHFRNNDTRRDRVAHSLHMHGLVQDSAADGFWYASEPDLPGTDIYPGEEYLYRYVVPTSAVGAWMYYDASAPRRTKSPAIDMRAYRTHPIYTRAQPGIADELDAPVGAQHGLFGMAIIEDGAAPAADRENIVILTDIYAEELGSIAQDLDCINGRSFLGNTPTFQAKVGERVRWRVGALGRENHVFHIHGHRWLSNGAYTDTHILGPGMATTLEYIEESPGEWLYHCHITEHMMGGMSGLYVVT